MKALAALELGIKITDALSEINLESSTTHLNRLRIVNGKINRYGINNYDVLAELVEATMDCVEDLQKSGSAVSRLAEYSLVALSELQKEAANGNG